MWNFFLSHPEDKLADTLVWWLGGHPGHHQQLPCLENLSEQSCKGTSFRRDVHHEWRWVHQGRSYVTSVSKAIWESLGWGESGLLFQTVKQNYVLDFWLVLAWQQLLLEPLLSLLVLKLSLNLVPVALLMVNVVQIPVHPWNSQRNHGLVIALCKVLVSPWIRLGKELLYIACLKIGSHYAQSRFLVC